VAAPGEYFEIKAQNIAGLSIGKPNSREEFREYGLGGGSGVHSFFDG